jgi:hypothetical protein
MSITKVEATSKAALPKKLPQAAAPFSCSNQLADQFTCMYNKKGPKKKKTYIDGIVAICGDKVVLKEANGANMQVASCRANSKLLASMQAGFQLDIGPFEVEILETASAHITDRCMKNDEANDGGGGGGDDKHSASSFNVVKPKLAATRLPLKPLLSSQPRSNEQKKLVAPLKRSIKAEHVQPLHHTETSSLTGGGDINISNLKRPRIMPHDICEPLSSSSPDPGIKSLLRSLQPHQIEAVNFMWRNATMAKQDGAEEEGSGGGGGIQSPSRSGGCILADSMGLGKTLSTIAFIYCCIHHRLMTKV